MAATEIIRGGGVGGVKYRDGEASEKRNDSRYDLDGADLLCRRLGTVS